MPENEKVFKKFFMQKSVLDSLRVFIELTDDFFSQVSGISIMPQDELGKIKEMQWPLNRNLLLQTIVKLPWDKSSFQQFCAVIEETQNDQLNKQIVVKAREMIEELNEAKLIEEMPEGIKEREGDHLSIQTKNAIKLQLKDRDEKIYALETENADLKTKMAVLAVDNQNMNNESADLDKCVTDMLTAIKFDLEEAPLEKLLLKVSEIYWRNIDKIGRLNEDIKSLKRANKELRERVTMFTDENITVKADLVKCKENLARLTASTTETIDKLTSDIAEEKEKSHQLQITLRNKSMMSSKQVENLEEELKAAKVNISKMKKDIGVANRDRDSAKEELREINDRTRKLLISLDLLNHCDSTSLSVDHARNIGYARRRRGPNAPQPPSPSEETLQIAGELVDRILPGRSNPSRGTGGGGELPNLPAASPRTTAQQPEELDRQPINNRRSSVSDGLDSGDVGGTQGSSSRSATPSEITPPTVKCQICGKLYMEASNYDGACLHHQSDATLLNQGTGMEVWSCCKSVETLKGCVRGRHIIKA